MKVLKSMLAATALLSMAGAPALAATAKSAPVERAVAKKKNSNEAVGSTGIIIGVIAAAAVIGGIIIIADDNNSPTSP